MFMVYFPYDRRAIMYSGMPMQTIRINMAVAAPAAVGAATTGIRETGMTRYCMTHHMNAP
jgi:hypothetical protein